MTAIQDELDELLDDDMALWRGPVHLPRVVDGPFAPSSRDTALVPLGQ